MEYNHKEMQTAIKSISYNFEEKAGYVYMPDACCVDMGGCIAFFERIDRNCSPPARFG